MANKNKLSDRDLLVFTGLFDKFDKASLDLKMKYEDLQKTVDTLIYEIEDKNNNLNEVYEKQQETNELLFNILENLSSGVILVDIDNNILVVNDKAGNILDIDKDKYLGYSFAKVFPQLYSYLFIQENADFCQEQEVKYKLKNQEDIFLYYKVSPIWDKYENIIAYLHIFEDLTYIKKLEESQRLNKNLQEIGQMTAAVAHEIRNPLSGITGFATLLERDLKNQPEQLCLVQKIKQGIRLLNDVANSVLSFNREIRPSFSKFSPFDLVESCLDMFYVDWERKGFHIEIIKEYGKTRFNIESDYNLLQSSLINIIKNAQEASKKNATTKIKIKIKLNLLLNQCYIYIKDYGMGMDNMVLSRLFSPFFTDKAEGTGLGLAIVKKSIESLNGTIEVKSQVGLGTTFKITIPIKNKR